MPHVLVHVEYDNDGRISSRQWMDDTIGPHNAIQHPDHPTEIIAHHEFLGMCNTDAALRSQAGYDQLSILPGESEAKTIWQRIVAACNHPDAPGHLQVLKLK